MLSCWKILLEEFLEKGRRYQWQKRVKGFSLRVPPEGIHLNYGSWLTSGDGGILHGGKVKIRHLQKFFPEKKEAFNLIYLVSSACPPYADVWVRWAKQKGVKMVWNQDGVAYPAWAGPYWKIHNRRLWRMLRLADFVFYQSVFCRESADRFLGPARVPWEVLPNCVDLNFFSPLEKEPPFPPWVLLSAGTHQQPERVFTVLDTLYLLKRRNREVRFLLAGKLDWPDGEREVREYARARELDGHMVRIPAFTQEEAPRLYRQAHILLHPKYKDPCPTVVIEAMACGLPVIGSRSGGLPELIGEQGGILIPVPDSWERMHYPEPERMADAVERICSALPPWRKGARRQAESRFSREFWLERHRSVFSQVLAGGA